MKRAKPKNKCASAWCRNPKPQRSDGRNQNHCWKCRSRMLKERHPATYVLNMIRHSARKRGLPFTITPAEFAAWCERTGYLALRGRNPEDATVDRIDSRKGYSIDNIRVLTHADNSDQGREYGRGHKREEDPF